MNNSRFEKIVLFFLVIIFANLLVLNLKIFWPQSKTAVAPVSNEEMTSQIGKQEGKEMITKSKILADDVCPVPCLEAINQATASIAPAPTLSQTMIQPLSVKEFYIPLGSGSTKSQNWVELAGIESVVDMNNYQNVKTIIFEASMRIPTANGKVYAKLFNVTEKHDVWYSEVEAEGSSGYRAESANLNLPPGRKLYRVMMKTTMGYESILDSARIKILLE